MRFTTFWSSSPSSISRRITIWFVVVLIPLALLLYTVYYTAERAVTDKLEEINTIRVEQTASRVRDLFQHFFASTNLFINDKGFLAALENPNPMNIEKLYAYRDSIEMLRYSFFLNKKYAIIIRDQSGNIYESDGERLGLARGTLMPLVFDDSRFKEWDIFNSASWSSLDLPTRDGVQKFIVFNRWIFKPDTSTQKGLVSIVLPFTYLEEIFHADDRLNDTYDIADEDHRIVFSTDPGRVGTLLTQIPAGRTIGMKLNPSHWTLYQWINESAGTQQLKVLRFSFAGALVLFLILFIALSAFVLREIQKTIVQVKSLSKQLLLQQDALVIETRTDYRIIELSQILHQLVHNLNVSKKNYERSQEEKKRLELSLLQQQINPHFLLNTLNTIRWHADKFGQNKISALILALSHMLKQQLYYEDSLWTIREEQEYLEHYIEIQRSRYTENFHVKFRLEPELAHKKILKMLLQPFVENCFEHAFHGREYGTITIVGRETENGILLEIADDGVGLTSPRGRSEQRIGIENVRSRIHLHYGPAASLEINSKEAHGVQVLIFLPVRGNHDEIAAG